MHVHKFMTQMHLKKVHIQQILPLKNWNKQLNIIISIYTICLTNMTAQEMPTLIYMNLDSFFVEWNQILTIMKLSWHSTSLILIDLELLHLMNSNNSSFNVYNTTLLPILNLDNILNNLLNMVIHSNRVIHNNKCILNSKVLCLKVSTHNNPAIKLLNKLMECNSQVTITLLNHNTDEEK